MGRTYKKEKKESSNRRKPHVESNVKYKNQFINDNMTNTLLDLDELLKLDPWETEESEDFDGDSI